MRCTGEKSSIENFFFFLIFSFFFQIECIIYWALLSVPPHGNYKITTYIHVVVSVFYFGMLFIHQHKKKTLLQLTFCLWFILVSAWMTGAAMCTPPSRSLFECFSLLWLLCYNSWTGHVFQHVCISLANARPSPHITLSSLCRASGRKEGRKWHQLVIMLLRKPAVRHWNLPLVHPSTMEMQ